MTTMPLMVLYRLIQLLPCPSCPTTDTGTVGGSGYCNWPIHRTAYDPPEEANHATSWLPGPDHDDRVPGRDERTVRASARSGRGAGR